MPLCRSVCLPDHRPLYADTSTHTQVLGSSQRTSTSSITSIITSSTRCTQAESAQEGRLTDLSAELGWNAHRQAPHRFHGVLPLLEGTLARRRLEAELHLGVHLCQTKTCIIYLVSTSISLTHTHTELAVHLSTAYTQQIHFFFCQCKVSPDTAAQQMAVLSGTSFTLTFCYINRPDCPQVDEAHKTQSFQSRTS